MLEQAPLSQLFDIFSAVKTELKKRKKLHKKSFKEALSQNDNFEFIKDDFIGKTTNLLAIPKDPHNSPVKYRKVYIKDLIRQDWSSLFSLDEENHSDYYVYAHCDPRKEGFKFYGGKILGEPFYVGKGRSNRAYDFKRNQGHGLRLKEIEQHHTKDEIVHFFAKGLTNREALELEAKLIYFFGTIYESNVKGILLNLDISKRPDFSGYIVSYEERDKVSRSNNKRVNNLKYLSIQKAFESAGV